MFSSKFSVRRKLKLTSFNKNNKKGDQQKEGGESLNLQAIS